MRGIYGLGFRSENFAFESCVNCGSKIGPRVPVSAVSLSVPCVPAPPGVVLNRSGSVATRNISTISGVKDCVIWAIFLERPVLQE